VTPDEAEDVLDEFGVEGLIDRCYPKGDRRRIALLRLLHANENAQTGSGWVDEVLRLYVVNPLTYREHLVEEAETLAQKLEVLVDELRKSIPVLAARGSIERENTGPGLETPLGYGQSPPGPEPPARRPSDWDDVPF